MKKKGICKKREGVYISLDRTRRLMYTHDSLEMITIKVGREVKDFLNIKEDHIATVAWAGLIWEEPGLTIKEVEGMIGEKTRGDVMELAKLAAIIFKAVGPSLEKDERFRREVFRKRGE